MPKASFISDPKELLLSLVSPEPNSGCWLWMGALQSSGYGEISFERKQMLAHRFSYELFVKPIPQGLHMDHLCRVRCCVNPRHLEPVTVRVNLLRGDTSTAKFASRTHCNNGHEFSKENTYINKKGARRCRCCANIRSKQYREVKAI